MFYAEGYMNAETACTTGHIWHSQIRYHGQIVSVWCISKEEKNAAESEKLQQALDGWLLFMLAGVLEKGTCLIAKECSRFLAVWKTLCIQIYYAGTLFSYKLEKEQKLVKLQEGMCVVQPSFCMYFSGKEPKNIQQWMQEASLPVLANRVMADMMYQVSCKAVEEAYFFIYGEDRCCLKQEK